MGSLGEAVEGLGYHFLAGAVLAGDEDVGVGGADARDELEDGVHGGGGGDEVGGVGDPGAEDAVFGFEPLGAAVGAVELDLLAEDGEEARVVPRLLDEVAGALAHGLDGEVDGGPGGHDDDGDARVVFADGGEEVEAFLAGGGVAGVVEVDEDGVEVGGGEALEDEGRGAGGFEGVALGAKEELESLEDVGLVVGDEEVGGCLGGHEVCGGATATANAGVLRCAQDDDVEQTTATATANAGVLRCAQDDDVEQTTATANAGVLCCAQDDDVEQTTATARSRSPAGMTTREAKQKQGQGQKQGRKQKQEQKQSRGESKARARAKQK